jgi:hypothetical protein
MLLVAPNSCSSEKLQLQEREPANEHWWLLIREFDSKTKKAKRAEEGEGVEEGDIGDSVDTPRHRGAHGGREWCCLEWLLSQQPDFKAQENAVVEFVRSRGHECIFLPKFHPGRLCFYLVSHPPTSQHSATPVALRAELHREILGAREVVYARELRLLARTPLGVERHCTWPREL